MSLILLLLSFCQNTATQRQRQSCRDMLPQWTRLMSLSLLFYSSLLLELIACQNSFFYFKFNVKEIFCIYFTYFTHFSRLVYTFDYFAVTIKMNTWTKWIFVLLHSLPLRQKLKSNQSLSLRHYCVKFNTILCFQTDVVVVVSLYSGRRLI